MAKRPRKHRILKVWCYALCLFTLMSALAVGMTGEPRSISVVGGVTFALGLLGTLMAALAGHRSGTHDAPLAPASSSRLART
jgi:hypothetical protein